MELLYVDLSLLVSYVLWIEVQNFVIWECFTNNSMNKIFM